MFAPDSCSWPANMVVFGEGEYLAEFSQVLLGGTTASDCRDRVLVCGASSGGVHGESGNSTSELSATTGEHTKFGLYKN